MLRSGFHFFYNLITLNPPSFPRLKLMENFKTSSMGRFIGIIGLIGTLATGCMFDLTDVRYTSTAIQPLDRPAQTFVLAEDVYIAQTPCGYSRSLHQKTHWELVGRITEGEVFRSRNQTLTVECSNIFEAYLVLSGKNLVGFYLPVEKGFVALTNPIPIPMENEERSSP